MSKGLDAELARTAATELERLKWLLWHGNAFRALQVIGDLKLDLDVEHPTERQRKLYKALAECVAAIFGAGGGLGHLAIQYARLAGSTVVAVDLVESKLQTAKQLGADFVINAAEQDPVAEIKKLGGADTAVSVAVSPRAFEQAFASLARGGTLVFVGLPADNFMKLPIFETVLNGVTIKGSIVGTRHDLEEVFALHAMGRTKVLYETRKLDQVNEAFQEVIEARTQQPRLVFEM